MLDSSVESQAVASLLQAGEALVAFRFADEQDIEALRALRDYRTLTRIPEGTDILVAEEGDHILGAVTAGPRNIPLYLSKAYQLRRNTKTEAWISQLFVREDQRRKRLGTRLVANMVAQLRNKGASPMYAGIAPQKYEEASKKIFAASGFNKVGVCICWRSVCYGTLMKRE